MSPNRPKSTDTPLTSPNPSKKRRVSRRSRSNAAEEDTTGSGSASITQNMSGPARGPGPVASSSRNCPSTLSSLVPLVNLAIPLPMDMDNVGTQHVPGGQGPGQDQNQNESMAVVPIVPDMNLNIISHNIQNILSPDEEPVDAVLISAQPMSIGDNQNQNQFGSMLQIAAQPVLLQPPPSTSRGQRQLTSRVEDHGWQESRLLLTDRASFLLNNPRMSDIRFVVGETRVEIFGHKTLLAMGSPVFEAQFFGSLRSDSDTEETIELPDFEPETFVLFLKYLYTDTLEEPIDDNKVLQLLRPAKKYIVPHLIEKCSDILMSELKPENVFQVHNYADFFDLQKLEGACLRFIDRECEAIIQTEEFTMLNSDTLATFLRRDGLNIKEDVLFRAVLRWAELECERKSVEISDENIREALGNNLRLLRFPTMSAEEFATEVASRNILTAEEARSIFIYMCSGYHNRLNRTLLPDFPTTKRGFYPHQYMVSRFSGEPVAHSLNYRSGEIYTYRFNIKADRQIFFKGVNIFSIKCGSNAQYPEQRRFNGAVYLYECDAVQGDRDLTREQARKQFSRDSSLESEFETSSGSRYFPVLFDNETRIPANHMFTVCAVVSVASTSYQQQPLNTFMGTDELTEVSVRCAEDLQVNFTFSNCYGEASVGRYTQSQIPEIVFSL